MPPPVQIQSSPRESETMRTTRLSASPSAVVKERIGSSRAPSEAVSRSMANSSRNTVKPSFLRAMQPAPAAGGRQVNIYVPARPLDSEIADPCGKQRGVRSAHGDG